MALYLHLNVVEENSPWIVIAIEIISSWGRIQREMLDIVSVVLIIIVSHVKIHVCKGDTGLFWV